LRSRSTYVFDIFSWFELHHDRKLVVLGHFICTVRSLVTLLTKVGVRDVPPDVATFIRTVVVLMFSIILIWSTHQTDSLKKLSMKTSVFLVLSGLATGASWICYNRALQLGNASTVAAIDKASLVLIAMLAFVFLNERLNVQSSIGIALIAIGTVIVALSKT
jgi:bacterial/archaeal transporter family protein